MDEGKLASQAISGSSEAQGSSEAEDATELKGRLRNPVTSQLDLGSNLNDDEDAISQMAKRFRGPGTRLSAEPHAPSLDGQQAADVDLSSTELQDFLLDALDGDDEQFSEYELEEFNATADTLERGDQESAAQAQAAQLVEPTSAAPAGPAGADGQGTACSSCQASNPPGMRFCVQCGGSLKPAPPAQKLAPAQATREPPPPSAAARQENPWDIHLISINEDGSDGISIALKYLETTLGCDGDTRFPTDAFLSPKHARLHIEDGELFIEDLGSLNGTFLKLRSEIRLSPGDSFLMGRQVLRFERFEQSITPKTKSPDGTRYMGSPAPGGQFKVLQVGIGNIVQNIYCLPASGAVLGREKGDIIFPHDKFMSSRHAQIYTGEEGDCYLVDLNSSNGTWIKLWEKTKLSPGDYIFMGQQLFRVHIG